MGEGYLRSVGLSAKECKNAGFSAEDCKGTGFSVKECKEVGFSAEECKQAGFTVNDLVHAKFPIADITSAFGLRKMSGKDDPERRVGARVLCERKMGKVKTLIPNLSTNPKSVGYMYFSISNDDGTTTMSMNEVNPPEKARSYSSVWDNNAVGTGHARSTLGSPQAWSAKENNTRQWMVIDLGRRVTVSGLVISGRGRSCQGQKVTRVKVFVGDSNRPGTAHQGTFQFSQCSDCGEYDCHTKNESE